MQTTDELRKVLAEKAQIFAPSPEFIQLREFYEEMKRQGVVKKQEYAVPPLDTAGQKLYQAQQKAFCLAAGALC
jgi:hypothetical protein